MKVVIINNDLRIFWKGRVTFLYEFLKIREIDLFAIELFGKGSPYAFDSRGHQSGWWSCLFPENSSNELSKEEIAETLFLKLGKINPDIVIASSIVFYAGALGLRWSKKHQKKFLMFDDAKPWQVKRNFIVQGIKDLIIKQSDALWLPSADYDDAYNYLKKHMLFFYGYNCIDNNAFKSDTGNKLNSKTIICVARLVPIKNIETLLKAWHIIEQKATDYKLIIVGSGPERDKLIKLSNDLNLKATEFTGTIDNDRIAVYYHRANALILPSLSETWGLVVNEAMASGLPVLLSNKVNACKSLLKEGVNGFSFEPLDAEEIANAIFKFITLSITAKQQMAFQSLAMINQMNYENMGEQLITALAAITSKKFKRPGFIAGSLINFWYGKYNTAGWDKL